MENKDWLEKAVFYNIYPQSFFDTDADGIGDLPGITERLDYISYMGYTALWLNPFYDSPFRDAGYDVTDFYRVAPRYGTNDDFRTLCEEAHKKGIRVCIDLVAGHTSTDCEWFKKSSKAEKNGYTNRYIWTDSWTNDYHHLCINGMSERNGAFMNNFFYSQPALNYGFQNIDEPEWQLPPDHPDCVATKRELMNIMEFWMGLGSDGFRVDMASSLIKNDPERIGLRKLWREIRAMMDEKWPGRILISEWACPHEALDAGFDIDFMLHFGSPAYTSLFRAEKGRNCTEDYPGRSFFSPDGGGDIMNFLPDWLNERKLTEGMGYIALPSGNHDMPRIAYRRTPDEVKCAMTFLLTVPGVPFIYYGDEIAMPYADDIVSKEGGYNRTGARTPMQWRRGRNAGFSEGMKEDLYLPVDEDGMSVGDQISDRNSVLNLVRDLIALRKTSDALAADGGFELLNRENRGYPLVFRRWSGSEEWIIAVNPTGKAERYPLVSDIADAVITSGDAGYHDGEIVLPPFSSAVIRTK